MSATATTVAARHRALAPVVRRSTRRRLLAVLTNAVLALGVITFFLIAIGPHVLGYRTATMLTGSMEPGISPGDVVVTVPKPAADVQVGDVISYRIPIEDHRVETHRITKVIHHRDGTIAIRTQGDNNPGVDPWTATLQDDTVWQMVAVVPEVGNAIQVLRSPAVRNGVFWVAFGGLLLLGMSIIWGSSDEDEESPEGPEHDADDADDADDDLTEHRRNLSERDNDTVRTPTEEPLAA